MVREFQKHTDGLPIPRSDIGGKQVDSPSPSPLRPFELAPGTSGASCRANTSGFSLFSRRTASVAKMLLTLNPVKLRERA